MTSKEADPVDRMTEAWAREMPGLDLLPMALMARLARLQALAGRSIEAAIRKHLPGGAGEFDVLAALRRAGAPFTLAPSDLARALMLSPAGMTSRLDRLEAQGLIERRADPRDRRSMLAALTERGRAVIEAAVVDHLANEAALLAPLSDAERRALDRLLRRLLSGFA